MKVGMCQLGFQPHSALHSPLWRGCVHMCLCLFICFWEHLKKYGGTILDFLHCFTDSILGGWGDLLQWLL
jgi:hypothetical protein